MTGTLKQIKYFQAVVRCRSFSEAAQECFISQSAMSQQIQALEQELGTTLLHREKRRFALTPAGEHFYRKSKRLIEDYEKLRGETMQVAQGDNYTLRIGCSRSYGGSEFQKAVARFTGKHPNIPVNMVAGNHEELYEQLRKGSLDLVLNDQRRAFSDEYANLTLATIGCYVEIAARSPLASMPCVDTADARNVPCILVASKEQQSIERSYYQEIYGIESEYLFAENLAEARLMVIAGQGFLPIEGEMPSLQYADTIVRRPLSRSGKPIQKNYCAFWKADNSGFYVEEFAEILKAQFH